MSVANSLLESRSTDRAARKASTSPIGAVLRLLGGFAVLAATLALFGIRLGDLLAHFRAMDARWTLFGLFVVGAQMALSAARWRVIAAKLAGPIPLVRATTEYYLSSWLNQILPGGLAGDAFRAARHAGSIRERTTHPMRRALLAVVLDRASGQLALWAIIAAGTPWSLRFIAPRTTWVRPAAAIFVGVVAAVLLLSRWRRLRKAQTAWAGHALFGDLKQAFLAPPQLAMHFVLSVLVVGSYVALFDVSARALRQPIAPTSEFWVVPLILAASTAPIIFSGWGVREAASAALYHAAGLDPALGAAVGLTYGLLTLAGSAPGILVLLLSRGRTEAPSRTGVGARPDWSVAHAAAMLVATGICVLFRASWPLVVAAAPSFALFVGTARRHWTEGGTFGAANAVTAARLLLVFAIAAAASAPSFHWIAAVLLLVLLLDGVDGWLARHFRTSTAFGACFDTEVDALFVLTGCLSLYVFGGFGGWVLIGGVLRYLTVLLLSVRPSPGGEPPRSRLGRHAYVVAVSGIIAAHALPAPAAMATAMASTLALVYSFSVSLFRVYSTPRPSPHIP